MHRRLLAERAEDGASQLDACSSAMLLSCKSICQRWLALSSAKALSEASNSFFAESKMAKRIPASKGAAGIDAGGYITCKCLLSCSFQGRKSRQRHQASGTNLRHIPDPGGYTKET